MMFTEAELMTRKKSEAMSDIREMGVMILCEKIGEG